MAAAGNGFPQLGSPEEARAEITDRIADLLDIDSTEIDPDSDLIAQGLDSIRMMTLAGRWRREGYDVDFARLAAVPSVRAWIELLTPAIGTAPVPSVPEPTEGEPFAMAPMQHAMWVGRHAEQQIGGVAAHLYVEFDGGAVDPKRFAWAAKQLAARHPMLRVQFLPDGTQRIDCAPNSFPVQVVDLQALDNATVEQRLTVIREAKSRQQLSGQVLELTLSLLPRGRTRLHVDLDMQAADAMSYRSLTVDLAALYRGDSLPDIGYTYQQYRQQLSSPSSFEADRQWWAERVPTLPDAPALPLVPVAQQADPHRPGRRWHWLDPQIRDGFFDRARRHGVTPAMALASSFADTVAGWSADPRFLLNIPLFGREPLHADVDKVVGDFTSSLLLDIDLAAADTPAKRAHTLQRTMREAAAHSSYPGLAVLRDLGRHRGTQVLAPVVFTSALGLGELFGPDVTTQFGTPVWIISQGPQVLLDAQVTEFDGGILLNWDVREDAFRPGVIDAMFASHVDEVLRLAHDDDAWDAQRRPLLPPAQDEIRATVNGSVTAPGGRMLHDGFFATAERTPDAPAVISSLGDWTYRQLRERALAVAAALRTAGLPDGGTVAVVGPKTAEQIPALLGIHAAGGVYLPIGADQPAERVRRIIAGGDVDMTLVCGGEMPDTTVSVMTVADAISHGSRTEYAPVTGESDRLAYVLFTSGSTGEPKGVEVTHDAAMNTVEFITDHFGLGPDDRCLALSTLECDISVLDVFATLATGGAIVVVDEEHRRDPDQWVRLIESHGVTVLHFLPGWLAMLLEVAGPLPTIRVVPTGGDWVTPEMARRLRERAPGVRFAGLGGATETAIHNTICEVTDVPVEWSAIPFGKPLPNNRCRVVADSGRDCPDWVVGELWIGGRGLARGYRGRPDLTAERFVEYDGMTWYRTGDLARYWPDGTCEFVGRADQRVKISGYRVELGEIDAALQRVPGVVGAVAVPMRGRGSRDWLAAAVQLDDGLCDTDTIRTHLSKELPQHMVPRHIEVFERIPYTVGGKVDRQAIVNSLAVNVQLEVGSRPPSGPVQTALAVIVAEVLGVSRVGVDDDFFALGGDSVLATSVVAWIRQRLDIGWVSVADMFATRTVAALANRLGEVESAQRLEQITELYLEVAHMNTAEVLSELSDQGRLV